MSLKSTGKNPSGKYLELIKKSPQYTSKGFTNLSPTPMLHHDASYFKMLRDFINKNVKAKPPGKIPTINTDLLALNHTEPVIVWFGHSSYLLRIEGKNFLLDPVFSGNASPIPWMIKAFEGSNVYTAAMMPPIDYLVLTHDHYDHLDYSTITKLHSKIKSVYCPLGVGAHLRYWGFPEHIVTEMDWWESQALQNKMVLTATPARHFSGRGIRNGRTLWSSYILETPSGKIYFGGDSGYDSHFKIIGDKHGPFDLALLESGQYNLMWPLIHMMPEETVQAAADLRANYLLPVHWGKFSLAMHNWDEPVQRVLQKAKDLMVKVSTPMIGEPVMLGKNYPNSRWWEF